MKKTRWGMVRFDTHACYFGAMLDACDPRRVHGPESLRSGARVYLADVS